MFVVALIYLLNNSGLRTDRKPWPRPEPRKTSSPNICRCILFCWVLPPWKSFWPTSTFLLARFLRSCLRWRFLAGGAPPRFFFSVFWGGRALFFFCFSSPSFFFLFLLLCFW